jgi:large subunit ribosomal protein L14e
VTVTDVGRICVKIVGREAGRKCIIVETIDMSFVLITGPKELTGVKRRRVNISHIEPTQEKIKIKRGATDEEIMETLKTSGKIDDMKKQIKSESNLVQI